MVPLSSGSILWVHPLAPSSGLISRSINSLNRLLGALAQYSNVAGDWLRGAESGPGIDYLGTARLANIALNIILNIYSYDSSILWLNPLAQFSGSILWLNPLAQYLA